jgi:phage-related protein (TIGR01555 family)
MLTRLKAAYRALFHPEPAPVQAPQKTPTGISVRALQNVQEFIAADQSAPRVELKMPELPPGVRPAKPLSGDALYLAMDSNGQPEQMAMDDGGQSIPAFGWLNTYGGLGCTLTFPGYPYLANLTQISEYRAPSEVISTEMTRKWLKIVSKGDKGGAGVGDRIKELTDRMVELKVRDVFKTAAWYDGVFGRGQVYIEIKGDEGDLARQKPLTIENNGGVKKGSLKSLKAIEPYWTTPASYNASYPERADYYVPQSWYIMGRKTHSTRLLNFVSREVPDILKPSYNFGGISMSQLMEPYVNMWLRTRKSVNDLINKFSITTLLTDLNATLSGGDGSDTVKRATLFTRLRDNLGLFMLNKGTEELGQVNTPLSTLDKLQAQSQEHMAAPCHIPLIKLFGVVPTGLNATGEGEIQVWYDFVRACQENLFGPQMDILIKVIQLDLWGSIDPNIGYEWVALDEPTAKEKAEERKSNADEAAVYLTNGVVDPDEVRTKLQSDPNSGWDQLQGSAPEPEEPAEPSIDPTTEASMGHEAEQNDAQREHELAITKLKMGAAA